MKLKDKNKARELRSQGLPINKIAKILNVAKSSVSIWVRDIELSEKQIQTLQQQNPIFNNQLRGGKARALNAREQRKAYQEEGRKKAQEGNLLHQAGCMLYWGEGSKHKNSCCITNTDVNLLQLFIKFLRENFDVPNTQLTITINYYTNNGLSKQDIEKYWLEKLNLSNDSIRKGQENNRPRSVTNAIRHNKHPYGMCCLRVNKSTQIVQHIYGAIQEYAGFSNNYMLM